MMELDSPHETMHDERNGTIYVVIFKNLSEVLKYFSQHNHIWHNSIYLDIIVLCNIPVFK